MEQLAKNMRSQVAVVGSCFLLWGCPNSTQTTDAFEFRDTPVVIDVFVTADSGVVDRDLDGTPDAADCAPDDATIGASGSRACTGACGAGTELCSDGIWAACNSPADCICDMPGRTRAAPCGMCGIELQTCSSERRWVGSGACERQGVCVAGSTDDRVGAFCDVRRYTCSTTTCMWDDGVEVVPVGECPRGQVYCKVPYGRLLSDGICTDDCRLVDNPACP